MALNTLLIREQLRNDYTETCVNIYLDNVRLGARLHSGGMYKDLTYHARYQEQCLDMMAYGITYAATAYSKLKLDYYKSIITNIDKYNDSCKILLGRGELIQNKEGKVELIKISKLLVEKYLSELYDSGLDEPTIYEIYGEGVYKSLIDGLKEANIKAGPSMMRKKKPFEIISSKLYYALGLDKVSPDNNIREYMYYSVAYNEFLNVWNTQIKDIYNIPKQFTFLGNVYDRRSYTDKIKKEYFPCTSPKEYDKMLEFLVDKYKIESAFLSMIYNNLNRMEIKKIFDSIYAGMNIDQAYQHFRTNISQYPNELKEIVQMYLSDPYGERMTDTFDDSRGLDKA